MKRIAFLFLFVVQLVQAQNKQEVEINQLLNNWHQAAAQANFNAYFDVLHEESIYIGTDATERWDKPAYIAYSKPHFDKGKAWTMIPLERHLIFSKDGKTVWFDELLDTFMKICRGSGVLVHENGKWYIKHYVLSMTIPNDVIQQVVPLKTPEEDKIIKTLK